MFGDEIGEHLFFASSLLSIAGISGGILECSLGFSFRNFCTTDVRVCFILYACLEILSWFSVSRCSMSAFELMFEGEYDIPLESVVVFSLIVGSMILIAAKKKLLSDHFIVFGLEGLSLCVDV